MLDQIRLGDTIVVWKLDRLARSTRDLLETMETIRQFRPLSFQWGLPSKFDSNPLIWMLTVNGMLVDVRHLPIEVQEIAYQKGLIPYVPGAKHS